jgi:hypothetical protein
MRNVKVAVGNESQLPIPHIVDELTRLRCILSAVDYRHDFEINVPRSGYHSMCLKCCCKIIC